MVAMIKADASKEQLLEYIKKLHLRIDELEEAQKSYSEKRGELLNNIERFRILYENTPLGYQSLDKAGNFIEVNKAWCETLGYSREEVIGRNFSEFIRPESVEDFKKNFLKFKKTGQIFGVEFEMISKSGTPIMVSFDGKIGYNSDNSFRQTHCILRNITDRKAVEDALLISEQFNRAIIENSPMGISIRNNQGELICVNDAWKKIWGLSEEEAEKYLARKPKELEFSSDVKWLGDWRTEIEKIYKEGGHLHIPKLFFKADETGIQRWISLTYYAIKSAKGDIERVVIITNDITKQVLAYQAIQDSEQFNRAIIENSPLGITVRSPKGKLLSANKAWKKIWNFSDEQVEKYLRMNPEKLDISSNEEWLGEWRPKVEKIYNEGGYLHIPKLFFESRESNRQRWISLTYYAIMNASDKVERVVIITNDITEQVLFYQALQESEKKFRNLADSLPQIIFETDLEGKLTYINANTYDQMGFTPEDFSRGIKVINLVAKKDQPRVLQNIKKLLGGDILGANEYIAVRKDGTTFPIIVHSQPKIVNGKTIGLQGIIIDISERIIAEKKLKKSEKKYHELFNSLIEGIGLVDEKEIIQLCNPAYAKIFEEDSPDKMIGKNLFQYIPEDRKQTIRAETEKLRRGVNSQYEMEILTAKGNRRSILVVVNPQYDDNNNYIGALSSLIDITEEKRLQVLEFRAQRLEAAGRVAGQVAHDFNNLLAPLVAYPEFIRSELPKDHSSQKYLNDMERAANQIADINQQLLTLSRRGHYNQEILNLNEIVEYAIRELGITPVTLVIETKLEPNLMNIKGGSSQIHRIISNLVHNSRDALRDIGNINIRTENYYADNQVINYGQITRGEYVKLTIEDNGCGIPEEIRPNIFDPFYTTKASDKKRGSGLGLSVVDSVIQDHNGYLDLRSKVGEGTSFYLYFPITRENMDSAYVEEDITGGSETILVVDDDKFQCDVVLQLLNKLGYKATAVNSGEEAIDHLKDNPYDLLILDLIMPGGIDAAETYRRSLQINASQKAIIISGYAETERVNGAMKLGIDIFLRKPITLRAIALAIRKSLDRKAVSV